MKTSNNGRLEAMRSKETPVKTRTGWVVSHTHWDREWRYPLWRTRLMLVEFMDELLDVLDKGIYPGFLLDGQVAPVLDYLEMRPEQKQRVQALVQAGKLEIGPWYTLPDEYPVDGECLVRNLLWGRRAAEQLGGVFNVGYTSFGWGQTAQLPQIYAGFGMDVAMIGKRVSKQRAPQSEFLWRAPDGSELLTSRFGDGGRQNLYLKLHLSCLYGVDHETAQWNYDWTDGGVAYHRADRAKMEQDHFRLDKAETWHQSMLTREMLEKLWQTTDESVLPDDRLMMNGCDYAAAQPLFAEMLAQMNAHDIDSNRCWRHTTMRQFVEIMRSKIDQRQLAVVDGELRDGPAITCTGNALSTRMGLKRLNKRVENALLRHAEPLAAMAAWQGAEYPQRLLDTAWRELLHAQPHDSINGVTQDVTAKQVEGRLWNALEAAEAVTDQALMELVKRLDVGGVADEDVLLVVFNPSLYPRREVLEAWVNMPPTDSYSYLIPDPQGMAVYDLDGMPRPTQWHGAEDEAYPVAELHTRARPYYCRRHQLIFDTGDLPAGGYRVYKVAPVAEAQKYDTAWTDERARTSTLLTGPDSMENEFLRVQMNPNGTFDLTDKTSGRTFRNLNSYEDRGEQGNYWVNESPKFDQRYCSTGVQAEIWAEQHGPVRATLVSEVSLNLPTDLDPARRTRSAAKAPLKIRTTVTLSAGQRRVDIRVRFENRHENHVLRVLLPTGLANATHAAAGGHFHVDQRPIRPQGPSANSVWPDMATLPMQRFIDVSDGEIGLAVLSDAFTEYEVKDNPQRTIALTLLRAVKNWICTERVGSDFPSQKGGQCLGWHEYHYAICPHDGDWGSAGIDLAADQFNTPCIPIQTRKHEGSLPTGSASLFEIDNEQLRFAAIKPAQDNGWIVRLYNSTDQPQKGSLRLRQAVSSISRCNLAEEERVSLSPNHDGHIPVTAAPHEIVTIRFKTAMVE